MVSLGEANSRMKDFADLWFLAQTFSFDGETLTKAISGTFRHRQTPLRALPVALTSAFAQSEGKQTQWTVYIRRSSPQNVPASLAEAVETIAVFLGPILEHLADAKVCPRIWSPGGPWQM